MNCWLLPRFLQNDHAWGLYLAYIEPYEKHRIWKHYSVIPGDVPLVGDSFWVGAWPGLDSGKEDPPPSPDYVPQTRQELDEPDWQGPGMDRFCTNRHNMAINMSFVGGHVKRVELGDLWALRWHKTYMRFYDIILP